MNIPDMDWAAGWSEELAKEKEIDWSSEYQRGYENALMNLLDKFEEEYQQAATEDPHFAYYSKYVIDTINKMLNPLIK
jgi:hypothetical protein